MTKVSIEKSTLERLVRRDMLMDEMESWGVDNWSGWEYVERPTQEQIDEEVKNLTEE